MPGPAAGKHGREGAGMQIAILGATAAALTEDPWLRSAPALAY
jgi:hypothetical protein